jgi:hypothetical protein
LYRVANAFHAPTRRSDVFRIVSASAIMQAARR